MGQHLKGISTRRARKSPGQKEQYLMDIKCVTLMRSTVKKQNKAKQNKTNLFSEKNTNWQAQMKAQSVFKD